VTTVSHPSLFRRVRQWAAFAALVVCCTPRGAAAQVPDEPEASESADPTTADQVELERGKLEYQSGRYVECVRVLGAALTPGSEHRIRDPELVREARLYHASCLIGSGQDKEADEELRRAIQEQPTLDPPDQRVFMPELVRRYIQIRISMRDELRQADQKRREIEARAKAERELKAKREEQRLRNLEQYAQVQSYTTVNSRWLASVPFGVGQFQNRDNALGYTFLVAEGLAGATLLTSLLLEISLHRTALAAEARGETLDKDSVNPDLRTLDTLTTVSAWSFLALAVGGIVEAQLAFVPQHTDVRYKPLPPELERKAASAERRRARPGVTLTGVQLAPLFAVDVAQGSGPRGGGGASPSGASLGFSGAF